jgi:ubiquitin C-terminal hydrolase
MKAIKRMMLSSVPNTLIIHLKRMDFNFNTFVREKNNDFFEFPVDTLDLYPYVKEAFEEQELYIERSELFDFILKNQSKEETVASVEKESSTESSAPPPLKKEAPLRGRDSFNYRLVGIVVHSGEVEAGHYYSFIRERTLPHNWYIFNLMFIIYIIYIFVCIYV